MTKISADNILFDNTTMANTGGALTQLEGTNGMGPGVERRLSKTVGIIGTSTGTVQLFEATDHDYGITKAIVRLSSIDGFVDEGSASIGIESSNSYDEIYPETKLEGLSSLTRMFTFGSALGSQTVLKSGQAVYFDIDVAYNATAAVLEVDLFGYEV